MYHRYRNGDTYDGEWCNDKWHGQGTYTYRDGSKVLGPFIDSAPQHKSDVGVPPLRDGTAFKSRPVSSSPSRTVLDASHASKTPSADNTPEEQASQVFQNSQLVVGVARFDFKNGGYFEGEWRNGQPWAGNMYKCDYFDDIVTYDGQVDQKKRNGKGMALYKNGDRYDGMWKDHICDGPGVLHSAAGGKFDGEFRRNVPWNGEMTNFLLPAGGNKFTGKIVEGKKDGQGVMWYHTGSVFRGTFRDDRPYEGRREQVAVFQGRAIERRTF